MQASAHPLPQSVEQLPERPVSPERYTHVHAAIGQAEDGKAVAAFLPANRVLPTGYTVTATDTIEAGPDREAPHRIIGRAKLPEPKSIDEIEAALESADPMVGPSWLSSTIAGARFGETERSFLGAWQTDHPAVDVEVIE